MQINGVEIDLGPLEGPLADPDVLEVLVDGYDRVYFSSADKFVDSAETFKNTDHLVQVIRSLLLPLGREVTPDSPVADVRLDDGTRVNIVMPPVALNGPTMVLRKMITRTLTVDDLIGYGSLTPEMVTFIRACVLGRLNIVISGGTGSGKTTLANVVADMIPEDERIILVEHNASMILEKKRLVRLEANPKISAEWLVNNSMKMHANRIILSETLGAEAYPMLLAMGSGFDGSMLVLHANTPIDALGRLEIMALEGNPSVPLRGLRERISESVDVILQMHYYQGRRRVVTQVTEVNGMEGDVVRVQDIFAFEDEQIVLTGVVPHTLDRIQPHLSGLSFN